MSELGNIDLGAIEAEFEDGEEVYVSSTVFIPTDFFPIITFYLYCIQIDVPLLGYL